MNSPQFPIFITSKGRAESRLTAKTLDSMSVEYRLVIEEQEYSDYSKHVPKERLLVLLFSSLLIL